MSVLTLIGEKYAVEDQPVYITLFPTSSRVF